VADGLAGGVVVRILSFLQLRRCFLVRRVADIDAATDVCPLETPVFSERESRYCGM